MNRYIVVLLLINTQQHTRHTVCSNA